MPSQSDHSARDRAAQQDIILDELYAAATDPEKWSTFLKRLCQRFDAMGGTFVGYDFGEAQSIFTAFHGVDPEAYRDYEPLIAEDPRVRIQLTRPNRPFSCALDLSPAELHASRVYREFLRPHGVEYTLAVGIEPGPDTLSWGLALYRGPDAPPFDSGTRDAFGELIPHVRRAATLFAEFTRLDGERWAAIDMLDQFPMGTILVDGDAHVLYASRAAERIVGAEAGITIRHGMVWATRSDESATLQEAIRTAVDSVRNGGTDEATTLLPLSRPSSARPLEVRVVPVARSRAPELARSRSVPLAALFISDPDLPDERAPELLTRLYGLTRGEANFLSNFIRFGSMPATAEHLGVSANTARSHLRNVFRKTGTGTQAELMRLVASNPAWLRNTARPPPDEFWSLPGTVGPK